MSENIATGPYCDACGHPAATERHQRCHQRRHNTDPPRFCVLCGRKLAVQVLPLGWTARCVTCGPVGEEIANRASMTLSSRRSVSIAPSGFDPDAAAGERGDL